MSQKNFAITPSVSISRSKFKRPSQHKTSFNLGDIVPIYVDADILPGDTVSLDLASLVRMSTPIVPIMDNIFVDYYAFFVPNRLVMNDWKSFMGENTSTYGAAAAVHYPVQYIGVDEDDPTDGVEVTVGSIGDYMGLPVGALNDDNVLSVSALPGRAYCLIYNEWFRDQNLIAPLNVIKTVLSSSGLAIDPNNSNAKILYNSALLKAAKESDYFTRALPYAQKGNPVALPLATSYAPIIAGALQSGGTVNQVYNLTGKNVGTTASTDPIYPGQVIINASSTSTPGMYTDLTHVTMSTINQLRFAFQYQKFLEKDALYGTRYWEILKGHFGVTSPDATLQRPEFLGHFRQHINIDQVLQTTGSDVSTPANNKLGTPGANSVSGKSGHLVSKSFVEHGILMILAVARHDQTYGQGINRMWTRTKREQFYFPVFANLGAQEIKNQEIYAPGQNAATGTFGFQEAWAEYRYKPNQVSGILNPSVTNNLGFWTLANNFGSAPSLSKSFIEQDRSNLARCLVTGDTGPDFIADFYFDATYVRPMPMYSLPGLIDHH